MSQMQSPIQSQPSGQVTDSQRPSQVQQGTETANAGELYPTKNYLSQNVRTTSIAALNQVLADVTTVDMQLKTAHWNVRGADFYQLHELFEELVEDFEPLIDMIAERATALGGQAMGTPPVVARQSNVPQLSPTTSDQYQLLQQLSSSLAALDSTIYETINRVSEQGDLDTADLLNEVSREVSEALWFVEAHLQGRESMRVQGQQAQQFQGGQFRGQQIQAQQ